MNYSKKLLAKIDNPKHAGWFSQEEAKAKNRRLVMGREGAISEGNVVVFYWLVDENDGVITEANFQLFGSPALIGAADVVCDLVLHKNYDQARRLTAELIDKQVRDKNECTAFPKEAAFYLNLVLFAVEKASDQCMDIPIADEFIAPPLPPQASGEPYPGWEALEHKQKIAVIEQIIADDIRPYIELDAGGIQIIDLLNGRELIIAYEGACTSCHSATGSTLTAIQQILRVKIHPQMIVTPQLGSLT